MHNLSSIYQDESTIYLLQRVCYGVLFQNIKCKNVYLWSSLLGQGPHLPRFQQMTIVAQDMFFLTIANKGRTSNMRPNMFWNVDRMLAYLLWINITKMG